MTNTKIRRLINQYNIDTLCVGSTSKLCVNCYVRCDASHGAGGPTICNRCEHRDDMEHHPDRSFIGFVPEDRLFAEVLELTKELEAEFN